MPAGTSKESTKNTKKPARPSVYPAVGFVAFNWRTSAIGNEVYGVRKKKIRLTQRGQDLLNRAQLIGNRRGFVVALICPVDGCVVKTHRSGDLPDGVLAECPNCKKQWIEDASS
jgi:hypothetical protein